LKLVPLRNKLLPVNLLLLHLMSRVGGRIAFCLSCDDGISSNSCTYVRKTLGKQKSLSKDTALLYPLKMNKTTLQQTLTSATNTATNDKKVPAYSFLNLQL
jgi:hypothetical protein